MDYFSPEDFIDFQRNTPSGGGSRPGFGGGPRRPGGGSGGGSGRPGGGPGGGSGRPGGGPGRPGGGPGPGFDPGSGGAPRSAPPNFTPTKQATTFRVSPSSIRNCVGRFTYVWLSNGDEFWMFPIQVSNNTVTGFRWSRFGWTFSGVSLNRIDAFMCV